MSILQITSGNPSMTSKEIADLVESRHDKVKQSIERLVSKGVISQPPMGDGTKSANGITEKVYIFSGTKGKRDSFVVVAQLSPEFTARIVDRWQELEAKQPTIPQTLPEALRLAADLAEQNSKLLPKALVADRLVKSDDMVNLTMASKLLGVQPQRFIRSLNMMGWIYRKPGAKHWSAYQPKINSGYLHHKFSQYTKPDGTEGSDPQVLVTTKGLAKLSLLMGSAIQQGFNFSDAA